MACTSCCASTGRKSWTSRRMWPGGARPARGLLCCRRQRWEEELKGPRQQAALAEMDAEIGNVRAAWNRAVAQEHVEVHGSGLAHRLGM